MDYFTGLHVHTIFYNSFPSRSFTWMWTDLFVKCVFVALTRRNPQIKWVPLAYVQGAAMSTPRKIAKWHRVSPEVPTWASAKYKCRYLCVFVCPCLCARFKSRMCGQAVVLLSSQGPLLSVRQVLLQPDQPAAAALDTHHAAASPGTKTMCSWFTGRFTSHSEPCSVQCNMRLHQDVAWCKMADE